MQKLLLWLLNQMGGKLTATSFEGASQSRRMRSWGISSYGVNTSLYDSRTSLVSRVRHLDRNNTEVASGVDTKTANIIGRGITPRWTIDDITDTVKELWEVSQGELDADERSDFYGLQALVSNTLQLSGEVLVQYIYRTAKSGLVVPLQLKVMECDHLDDTNSRTLPNGNTLRMGIEYNKSNKRTAYHLYKNHPGETYICASNSITSIRIPANRILHIFHMRRPGQLRGYPMMAPALARIQQFDEYEDATLAKQKVAAMLTYFIEAPEADPSDIRLPGEEVDVTNPDGTTSTYNELEPMSLNYLDPGEKVVPSPPTALTGDYVSFGKRQLQAIAKAMGLTYEQLTGDLAGVNYSSIRAGLMEVRRIFRMIQNNILVHQLCKPVAQEWLDVAYITSAIKISNYLARRKTFISRMKWDIDGWEWVDPLKSEQAEILAIRSGRKSLSESLGERGKSADSVLLEIQNDNTLIDKYGLQLDSDGRKMTRTGIAHSKNGGGADG